MQNEPVYALLKKNNFTETSDPNKFYGPGNIVVYIGEHIVVEKLGIKVLVTDRLTRLSDVLLGVSLLAPKPEIKMQKDNSLYEVLKEEKHDSYWNCRCPSNFVHRVDRIQKCLKCNTHFQSRPKSSILEIMEQV
ncbi:hypothetical protein [Leptospira stimsonii]|uniref:Uncharacterized protein n=1 Tax=Leptospira stimsonii TaxID=2202203 RepID=A0ABY2N0R2_9LEPT|nr:hypothetical protein [Leptospira stimsonii]TGK12829.1 hypothetical protein EHO98_19515 [Leptospira stimsonii]TGM13641.1 hypothetical protein EHQ90_13440 [Leptospira stimsonii]